VNTLGADLLGNRIARPTAILKTCHQNIAYDTLPFIFVRMLLPPHEAGLEIQRFMLPAYAFVFDAAGRHAYMIVRPAGLEN
jgi:hypothetical protein